MIGGTEEELTLSSGGGGGGVSEKVGRVRGADNVTSS